MKAVIAHGAGDLRVEDLAEPALPDDLVAVRIVYGGICGSDLHYAKNGANGAYTIAEPLTLGHEVVGVVVSRYVHVALGVLQIVAPSASGAPFVVAVPTTPTVKPLAVALSAVLQSDPSPL